MSLDQSGNLYLIGPMGSGKTTIGRQLAKILELPFYDSDHEIISQTGVDISTIFAYEGEAGFRKREQKTIEHLTQLKNIVLSTGGGAVLDPANCELLCKNGFVVYLRCSVHHQLERAHKDPNRPLLDTEDPRKRLQDLMLVREPLYRACAHFSIDTGSYSSRSAVKKILCAFHKHYENTVH